MDINRYIAEEIYGESEPSIDVETLQEAERKAGLSEGKNWQLGVLASSPTWIPRGFDTDFDRAMDAVIKAASPEHDEYSVILERTTHCYYAFYSEDEIYLRFAENTHGHDIKFHGFPVGYSTSGNGSSQALANLAVQIHKQRNN